MNLITFNVICFLMGIAISCIPLFRKGKINKVLFLILFLPTLNILNNIIILSGHIVKVPYYYFIAQTIAQFFAPLVLLYTRYFTSNNPYKIGKEHILTVILITINLLFIVEYLYSSPENKTQYFTNLIHGTISEKMILVNFLFIINQFFIFFYSYFEIKKYSKLISSVYSNDETFQKIFIKEFILFLLILNFTLFIAYMLLPNWISENIVMTIIIITIDVSLIILAFKHYAFYTNNTFTIFKNSQKELESYSEVTEPLCSEYKELIIRGNKKYALAEIEYNFKILEEAMHTQKLYKNPNITISILAQNLQICSYSLSATISEKFNKSFYDYINELRIKEFIQLIESQKGYIKIEPFIYESGFASNSTFYRAFKKYIGISPKEYMQLYK